MSAKSPNISAGRNARLGIAWLEWWLTENTQMGGAVGRADWLDQWDTFVRPEHRGRRLGIAVKIPNLHSLQAGLDHPAVLHT